jgi:hypothetical protein
MSTVPVTPETPPSDTAAAPPDSSQLAINWAEVVSRIRRNEAQGLEELYRVFSRGIRFYLCRQLNSQDLDDKIHDAFVIVVQAIRRGELREPERLMGFVRTVVRRQVAGYIDEAVTTPTWSRHYPCRTAGAIRSRPPSTGSEPNWRTRFCRECRGATGRF